MCDQEHGSVLRGRKDVLDQAFRRLVVEMCGRLVEPEHRRAGEQRACQHDALTLASLELPALLTDDRIHAVGEQPDPVPDTGSA